jgi:osmotically-inducible protein OsmY
MTTGLRTVLRRDAVSGAPDLHVPRRLTSEDFVYRTVAIATVHHPKGDSTMGKNKDIKQAVVAELEFDPLVNDGGITVQNIGGEVALNGVVGSYPQYLEAVAAAQRIEGVTRVHNHLEVVLPASDYRDDVMLTTAANDALTLAVTVPGGVEARAKDGNVTLAGSVSYGSQRAAAAAVVTYLYGVRNIKNDIEVWSTADPLDVLARVQSALDRNALILDDSDVVVSTDESTVTLSGNVRTWAEHDAVNDAAWRTDGVYYVRDDLIVTG